MHYSMVNEKRLSPKGTQIRAIKVVMIKRFKQHVAKDKINSRVGYAGVGEFRIHICCFFFNRVRYSSDSCRGQSLDTMKLTSIKKELIPITDYR